MKAKLRNSFLVSLIFASFLGFFIYGAQSDFRSIALPLSLWSIATMGLYVNNLPLRYVLYIALILRLLFFFTSPTLSDDYHRYIWDGGLTSLGIDPYAETPEELIKSHSEWFSPSMEEAYLNMNSPNYHSVYPPLSQTIFQLCYRISQGIPSSYVSSLRLLFLFVEIVIWLNLLSIYKIDMRCILILLNPFLLIEFYGNLHFDFLMSGLLVLSILYRQSSALISAIFASLAMAIKPQALIFIPFIWISIHKSVKLKWLVLVCTLFFLTFILPFLYVFDVQGILEGFHLYFTSFEFYGPIYHILNSVLSSYKGYNMIAYTGPILAVTSTVIIAGIILKAWIRSETSNQKTDQIFASSITAYLIYLLFSTTVHPWYYVPVLVGSVYTDQGRYYPIYLVGMLSYAFYDPAFKAWSNIIVLTGYSLILYLILAYKKRSYQTTTPS